MVLSIYWNVLEIHGDIIINEEIRYAGSWGEPE